MTTVASLCSKAMVLDHGNVIYQLGNVSEAIEHYLNFAKQSQLKHKSESKLLQKSSKVIINDFNLIDVNGISLETLTCGIPVKFLIDYTIDRSIKLNEIGFTILIKTLNGDVIANLSSFRKMGAFSRADHSGQVCCCINRFPIAPGTITMTLVIERKGEVLDMIEDVFFGEVDRGGHLHERTIKDRKGWVEIEHEWTIL